MIRAPCLSALLAMVVAGIGRCQLPVARVQLVRCAATSDAPCVSAGIELGIAERAAAAQFDSGSESAAWRGRLGGVPLVGAGVSRRRSGDRPLRLLILVDRGAEMNGERTAFTRIALKSWIAALDSSTVRIAVAGFDDSDSLRNIDEAVLGTASAAVSAIDRLPRPQTKALAPLYIAVTRAARRIDRELRAAEGSQGGVMVITAGRNDIGRAKGTEPPLTELNGLTAASAAIATAGRRVWVIVLGSDQPVDDLRMLVGSIGAVTAVPVDPNALANRLTGIAREFARPRQLTFGLGATEAALGRSTLTGTAELRVREGVAAARALYWRPPLLAMPVFQGVADTGALSPALREVLLVGGNGTDRSLIALLVALVVLSLWLLVPRLAWVDHDAPRATPRESVGTQSDTIAGGVPETAPRKPEDITHQTARRSAMRR